MTFYNKHFAIILLIGINILLTGYCFAEKKPSESEHENNQSTYLPIETLEEFTRAYEKIKNDYVNKIDSQTILTNAIKGMLSELDPHSAYLDEKSFEDIREGTSGEFSGLGMEVNKEEGYIKVIAPIDDTPAERAGILAGDLIIKINGQSTRDLNLEEAVTLMRGKVGTSIELTILHEDEKKPVNIKITREVIKVSSIKSDLLIKDYAYIRISSFQSRTASELESNIKELVKQNNNPLKGLILDLRNNPGGILSGAIDISDLFLESGKIVYTKGQKIDASSTYSASAGDILNKAPIIILVNKGSASASEIVAGALQDHKRAIIMGRDTFGKGSVQTILPVSNKTAIKLTTSHYYTPSGRSIQAKGIEPDIVIANWKLEKAAENDFNGIKEENLKGHLLNPDEKENENNKNENKTTNRNKTLTKDFMINEALNMLQGINILKQS